MDITVPFCIVLRSAACETNIGLFINVFTFQKIIRSTMVKLSVGLYSLFYTSFVQHRSLFHTTSYINTTG